VCVKKGRNIVFKVISRAVYAQISVLIVINYSLASSKALSTQRTLVMIPLVDGVKQALFVEGVTTLASSQFILQLIVSKAEHTPYCKVHSRKLLNLSFSHLF
jgi:hypothetical protein